jgi:fucose permease
MTTTALSSSSDRSKLTRVLIAYLSFIGIGINSVLLNLAWRPMSVEFAQPLEAVGIPLFASTIGYLASSFLTGAIASRLGIGWTVFAGAAGAAAGLALTALASSWVLLLPCFALAGFGAGLIDAGFNAYFAEHHSKRTLNWLHASFGIGATIGPTLVTAVLASQGSWRLAYLLAAGVLGVITLAFLALRKSWLTMAAQTQRSDGTGAPSMMQALRLPVVWLGMFLFFMYGGAEYSPGQWTSTLFTDVRGIASEVAGFWVSIYWGSFTIGRIFFGAIIDRLPTRPLIRACLGGALLGTALLWINPVEWLGFFGLVLLGFSLAPMFPVFISLTPQWVGARHAPNAIGFQVAFASLGIAAVPALIGAVAANIDLALIAPSFLIAVAVVVVLFEVISRQRRRD